MKRWQARGEVLDSDDEEDFDLEGESPAREKARIDDGLPKIREPAGRKVTGEVLATGDATEPGWIQPKVANTYGRRSRAVAAITQPDRDDTGESANLDVNAEYIVNQQAEPSPISTWTSKAASPSHQETTEGRAISIEPDIQSSISADLPDIHDVLDGQARSIKRGSAEVDQLSSGLSSPLSERSISPPAPSPVFHFPRPMLTQNGTNSAVQLDDRPEHHALSATPGEIIGPTQIGRRTFRERKAQQLHPYEYEKALFNRQWTERGLRPVRIAERQAAQAQGQDSSDNEQDSWQPSQQARSSPARASSALGDDSRPSPSDHHDVGVENPAPAHRRTAIAVVPRPSKKQKLSHQQVDSARLSTTQPHPLDEFSVPPSPPPTSSESNAEHGAGMRPAVFKFPRGMTPIHHTQQPTPNVSSGVRHLRTDSDDDLPPRPRLSTVSRSRHAPIAIDSSTEFSATDSEPDEDPDVRRLLKERKRIRGVLPASWLRIDFKAQQGQQSASPAKRRGHKTSSPERAGPQRGVAQRVNSRPTGSTPRPAPMPISDSDSDSDRENDPSSYLTASKKRQSRLQFNEDGATTGRGAFFDDDDMEVDHVDAMLAGTSRPRSSTAATRKRQPRITDAFYRGDKQGPDFSEERRAAKRATGASTARQPKRQRARQRKARKSSAPLLSIVDAPSDTPSKSEPQPQFVKLAIRRARAQDDHGRHSPGRKHIRLATEQDTDDAISMLRAWREGTVAPRQQPSNRAQHGQSGQRPVANERSSILDGDSSRMLLSELLSNRQSRLPGPLRTVSERPKVGARRLNLSNPKMRQTRLERVTSEHGDDIGEAVADTGDHPPAAPVSEGASRRRRHEPRPQAHYRGAQLESLESDFDQRHRAAAFERRMHVMTENVSRGIGGRTPGAPMPLERFLHESVVDGQQPEPGTGRPSSGLHNAANEQSTGLQTTSHRLVHRTRKRMPQRLDAEARQYRQPSEPVPDLVTIEEEQPATHLPAEADPNLQGLGPFGIRYAIDFDILPLPLGTYFHDSSFIGSGDFAASLDFAGRNLDVATGRIRIHIDGKVLDLGMWNEEVAAGLPTIPAAVSDALSSLVPDAESPGSQDTPELVLANVDYLLRSTVRYFTRCLAFSDPIDRRACIKSLHRLVEDTLKAALEPSLTEQAHGQIRARCLHYATALARQAVILCQHATVASELVHRSQDLFQTTTRRLAEHAVNDVSELRAFYEDMRRAAKREAGIRDADTSICSFTVLHHIFEGLSGAQTSFWTTVHHAMGVKAESITAVSGLDRIWCNIFSILPALEIDHHGVLQLGSRLSSASEDWSLCKSLLERVFQLYPASSVVPGSTINEYVRASLMRCFRLQDRWGWFRCEPILNSISDFFSKRGLAQLHKEVNRGSPDFLQELELQPSLDVHAEDRSFHIFLKMLCSGLRAMYDRGIYPDNKIGGIAWRFIPNHGRTHRKDDDLQQMDLDALRNHHDLLAAIYYASPPGHRLRISLIQNLVDHTTSHREACRLNVRTWQNLAGYQASTGEHTERLDPFTTWFSELLCANIAQYRMARMEVEQDAASAIASGKPAASRKMIECIIAANQRQIAATITDALAALRHALASAHSLDAALTLARGTSFWNVFDLFDPAARKVYGMFEEALEVVKTALSIQKKFRSDFESQSGSDDSQDYGDSSALQALASTQIPPPPTADDMLEIVHASLAGFLSSVFGADDMQEDGLLTRVVDVWVEVASLAVAQGRRTWQDYVNSYSSEAWSQLRDTEQRRKYTPYFLAKVVESPGLDLPDTGILSFWLNALVDREATLKFQHVLTNALMNWPESCPLLVNLPFIRPGGGRYEVSLHELRQCRLCLISSVLSNMHQHFDEAVSARSSECASLRRTYADMLRQMMQAMKTNYLEVQVNSESDAADPSAQGDYIGFVQQVVSFLQQYTTEICSIDRFFTDSAAFPLPATDPTYVVGRLKGYVSKLSNSNKRKELAVFVHTVSERAAVDKQQQYLVDQLTTAMTGALETGEVQAPRLRHVLMTSVFPAYIDNALSTASSWILALPILQACGNCIPDLLYTVRMEDERSMQAALQTIAVPLRCMLRVVETAISYPGQLMLPHVVATLSAIFETVQQSLMVMHHLAQSSKDRYLLEASKHFDDCAPSIQSILSGDRASDLPEVYLDDAPIPKQWSDTAVYSRRTFEDNLNKWQARDGQHFLRQGTNTVEVAMDLGDAAEEKERLLEALRRYRRSYVAIFGARVCAVSAEMEEIVV